VRPRSDLGKISSSSSPNETFGPVGVEAISLGQVLAKNPASRIPGRRPGSAGSAVQALTWLRTPGSVTGKLYRFGFAIAACCATAYLAAYGIIGIRLWSY
jgi:hypothetical protein